VKIVTITNTLTIIHDKSEDGRFRFFSPPLIPPSSCVVGSMAFRSLLSSFGLK
jgi:hypothetical protein